MSPDTHPIPTHGRLTPDPIPFTGAIGEQPPAAGIATASQLLAFLGQREGSRQQIVRDGVPTGRGGADGPVSLEPVGDAAEGSIHVGAPGVEVERGVVVEATDRGPHRSQARELSGRQGCPRIRDSMRGQEFDRALGCIQMVMRRFAVPRSSSVMGTGPVEAIRQPERRVRSESPCNGVHRR